MLDRILRGENPEGLGKDDGLVADRHLAFLHRLQERALHLGGRAIDLVGEEYACDDRSRADVEGSARGTVDLGADQVGRKQVGGELDALEGKVESRRDRANGSGLGEAGHALDEDVSSRQERDDQPLQKASLTNHRTLDMFNESEESGVSGLLASFRSPLNHLGGFQPMNLPRRHRGRRNPDTPFA